MAQTVQESAGNAEDLASIPGLGKFPGEGNGYPFQHLCLENSVDRGGWQATVHGVTKELDMTKQLNNNFPLQIRSFAFAGMCNGAS